MKSLPKALRPRRRYIFFEVEHRPLSGSEPDERDLQRAIWFSAQNLFGDLVSSKANLKLVEYSSDVCGGNAVLRCNHGALDEARAALACLHEIDGVKVGIRVLGVSGTLKSGRRKHLKPIQAEKTEVEEKEAWKRDLRLDVVESDRNGKQKKSRDTKFIGATVHDF